MILAVVDDLLFRSKIRTTANQLGVPIAFARTQAELLSQAKDTSPQLVILDLNNAQLDPIAAIASMKAAGAASVRLLAFASHVRTDLIEAATAAGADEVLPRSAFAAHLAEILSAAS